MKYTLWVALRHLRSKKKSKFLSIISFISIAGVFIGVLSLIIVIGVMSGFENDLKKRILGFNAHIYIYKYYTDGIEDYQNILDKLKDIKGISSVGVNVSTEAVVSMDKNVSGCVLKGISDKEDIYKEQIINNLVIGKFQLEPQNEAAINGYSGIILGYGLAQKIAATEGAEVTVALPNKMTVTPFGVFPKIEKFIVTGIVRSGIYQFDDVYAFISLEKAQYLFDMPNSVSSIEIRIDDIYKTEKIQLAIDKKVSYPYYSVSWKELNHNLFAALKLEKIVMFIILTLIVLVAAFNIVSTLIMVVMERKKDIGILKALGATKKEIMQIFTIEGLIIGGVGTILGVIFGLLSAFLLSKYKFIHLPKDVYMLDTLPILIQWQDIAIISISSILITYLATIYPAYKAANLDPVEAIRNE